MESGQRSQLCRKGRSASPASVLAALALACAFAAVERNANADAVTATIVANKERQDVLLLECDETTLYYSFPNAPTVRSGAPLETVRVLKTNLDIPRDAVFSAVRQRQWGRATALLMPLLIPHFPFLKLQDNPATAWSMRTGNCLVRSAAVILDECLGAGDSSAARRELQTAAKVFQAVSRATWYELAEEAHFRGIFCKALLGETEDAETMLEASSIPGEQDDGYGAYFLARSAVLLKREAYSDALEAALQTILFDNKNSETFPDALLISALCYERLESWHRARDVYYEAARLFPRTFWQRVAVERLQFIMDEDLTVKEEEVEVERVFFGIDEDMNEKVTTFLQSYQQQRPEEEQDDNAQD